MTAQNSGRRDKASMNPLIGGIRDFIRDRSVCMPNAKEVDTHRDVEPIPAPLEVKQQAMPSNDAFPQLDDLPKRYTFYQPMLLLGPTFPSHTTAWEAFYSALSPYLLQELHRSIADAFCRSGHHVTHIALNSPIQMNLDPDIGQQDNLMRSPANLRPLYGDFGPETYVTAPWVSKNAVDAAFWVETSQVSGIKQVWAPRWTMFSRGNIREKTRILSQQGLFSGLSQSELGQPLTDVDVVDFYIGIGYFALPYLKRGVRRVFGWDLNPWSVEGLRRGCEKNGWSCLVIEIDTTPEDQEAPIKQVVEALLSPHPPRCLAFCGDNKSAAEIIASISRDVDRIGRPLNVRHCNLGLLPTSRGAWDGAVQVLNSEYGGWLHVHENAEISQVKEKEQEVLAGISGISRKRSGMAWQVSCEKTEMVKTYAPGVGHYVFDINLWPAR